MKDNLKRTLHNFLTPKTSLPPLKAAKRRTLWAATFSTTYYRKHGLRSCPKPPSRRQTIQKQRLQLNKSSGNLPAVTIKTLSLDKFGFTRSAGTAPHLALRRDEDKKLDFSGTLVSTTS
jgi:hypothetical protein